MEGEGGAKEGRGRRNGLTAWELEERMREEGDVPISFRGEGVMTGFCTGCEGMSC